MKATAFSRPTLITIIVLMATFFCLTSFSPAEAVAPDDVRSIYIPAERISHRIATEIIHYAGELPINAAVLHVKDPFGRLAWKSAHPFAQRINERNYRGSLPSVVKRLKAENIWTIAKIDVFADDLLVEKFPELGLADSSTGMSWRDRNGLNWANPYDPDVWDYIITLAREAAAMGFDEIQFDYIRFPSDGKLAAIVYPKTQKGLTRAQTIGTFLEKARAGLSDSNTVISVDLFGLVAWKRNDFGVGQVIEEIAPHVDVICPMLYPSHFPSGFLGKQDPGKYPFEIMKKSTQRLLARTQTTIRPWVQGFWYKPSQITAQFDGITAAGVSGWSIWNPSGNYRASYAALASQLDHNLTEPEFYASMESLRNTFERITKGSRDIVNLTNYHRGFTILSLEKYSKKPASSFHYPGSLVETLDEGLMDHIMARRSISFGKMTPKHVKSALISNLMLKDLNLDARKMRPGPIYLDWENDCRFTRKIPGIRLDYYKWVAQVAFSPPEKIYISSWEQPYGDMEIIVD